MALGDAPEAVAFQRLPGFRAAAPDGPHEQFVKPPLVAGDLAGNIVISMMVRWLMRTPKIVLQLPGLFRVRSRRSGIFL